ncbi:MAG: biotin--[acetyl-CoA-carboxylase] ligase [Acidobacteria bacterium]|nr:biotin--[acetyl-CoA-carboxylase] ligase [Acidobacteriota bacterium]MCB9378010.1 biotin--[acetyl-CoA-carboxylase] ligase [Holophagales bacterium]
MSAPGAPAGEPDTRSLARAWPERLRGVVNLVALDSVGSTQSLARRILDHHFSEDETPEPFAVAALEQTAGRGRRGRPWASAPGLGIWVSLALPFEDPGALQSLAPRVAVSLAETANRWVGGGCRLKWPNDLTHEGRKLGGVLIDAISRASGPSWAIVGLGVNHGHGADDLPTLQASSLVHAGGDPPPLPEALGELVAEVWSASGGEADWIERFRALSAHRPGDPLECETASGERVSGRFVGFDDLGHLRIESAEGPRTVTSGEVFG